MEMTRGTYTEPSAVALTRGENYLVYVGSDTGSAQKSCAFRLGRKGEPRRVHRGFYHSPQKLVMKILTEKRGKACVRAVATQSASLEDPRCTSSNMAF